MEGIWMHSLVGMKYKCTHTHTHTLISSKKADGEIHSKLSLYLFILFHSLKKNFSRVCHFSLCLPSHFRRNLPWLSSGTANPLWIWIGWKNGRRFFSVNRYCRAALYDVFLCLTRINGPIIVSVNDIQLLFFNRSGTAKNVSTKLNP